VLKKIRIQRNWNNIQLTNLNYNIMKKLLLLLVSAVLTVGLFAQLDTEDNQILYLSFDDDTELGYNDEDIDVVEEADMEGDEGQFEGAALFNGSSSYIVFDLIPDWNHSMDFSISVWMQTELTGGQGILAINTFSGSIEGDDWDAVELMGGFGLFFDADDILGADCSWINYCGPDVPEDVYNDGEWHHVVVTFSAENSTMTLYVDNVLYVQSEDFDIAGTLEEPDLEGASVEDDNLKLGYCSGTFPEDVASMVFSGLLDDFRLFNIELTAENVDEIFNFNPTTGISGKLSSKLFKVYPNPATSYIQIQTESKDVDVNIFDAIGQNVISTQNKTRIDISTLNKGLYFVEVKTNGFTGIQKVLVK
jgi:hypothetical protein